MNVIQASRKKMYDYRMKTTQEEHFKRKEY